jgi:hypothetical protein
MHLIWHLFCAPESLSARTQPSQLLTMIHPLKTHALKGRYQPAGLNFGDCLAYALAKVTGEPLLYKEADFTRTDIEAA